jgi:hypothetical protein
MRVVVLKRDGTVLVQSININSLLSSPSNLPSFTTLSGTRVFFFTTTDTSAAYNILDLNLCLLSAPPTPSASKCLPCTIPDYICTVL